MLKEIQDPAILNPAAGTATIINEDRSQEALLKTGALQNAIFNSPNFSSIATDEKGVIQIFNVGAKIALNHHERWDGGGYPNRPGWFSQPSASMANFDIFVSV